MSSDKTEEPTPKKLEDARRRGDIPFSKDLHSSLGWLIAVGSISWMGSNMLTALERSIRTSLVLAENPYRIGAPAFLKATFIDVGGAIMPWLMAIMVIGAALAYLQVGSVIAFEKVMPKLENLDVIAGFGRMVSKKQWVELIKSTLVLSIVAFVLMRAYMTSTADFVHLTGESPSKALFAAGQILFSISLRAGGAWLAIGVLDFFWQRHQHIVGLRMTKDEVKREYKDAEGDPHTKSERQRVHREALEHATVESVRRADVLVVNPTHVAVALQFDADSEQEAPEVIAKGIDHLARRMIEVAQESGVPIMRDIPLARALHELEIGEQIPEALYEAVAIILEAAWAERESEGG